MEDLGKKEKTAGREVYSHIAWADKMVTVVKRRKIGGNSNLHQACQERTSQIIERKGWGRTCRLDSIFRCYMRHGP